MSDIAKFLDACRKANGGVVSLRSVFPGRGRLATETRKRIRESFGAYPNEGVEFDRTRGVFVFTGAGLEESAA